MNHSRGTTLVPEAKNPRQQGLFISEDRGPGSGFRPSGEFADPFSKGSGHINKLYEAQAACHQEGHSVANVVLAGLTLAWLDAVHNCWNTVPCESAMRVLRAIGPEDRSTKRDYKLAARGFLRRSGWWIKRRMR